MRNQTFRPIAPEPPVAALTPWTGARVVLRLLRLAAGAATRRSPAGGARAGGARRTPIGPEVRVLAGAITALLVLGTAALVTVDDATSAELDTRVAGPVELSRLRVDLPEPADHEHEEQADPAEADTSGQSEVAVAGTTVGRVEPDGESSPNLLPIGKGMWFHHIEHTGRTPEQLVESARAAGLTHLYVRLGSSKGGFYGHADLDRLLAPAHEAGLKVVGWDFPYLDDPVADAERAAAEISYETPDGHRIDAFSADIETVGEGVQLTTERVTTYASVLRARVGPDESLIGTVPNACLNESFPYAVVAEHFDAIAPMVYWITRDPAADVACNMEKLGRLGRPVLPIGQAYDPAIDNPELVGLVPRYEDLARFMEQAAARGAAGVSFWAWHTATSEMWQAIVDSTDFSLTPMEPGHADPRSVAVLQRTLVAHGYPVAVDGEYDAETANALAALQEDLGIAATGSLDEATVRTLLGP